MGGGQDRQDISTLVLGQIVFNINPYRHLGYRVTLKKRIHMDWDEKINSANKCIKFICS